ncbi:16S rRNA (guanine(527)-N(7))-methyltransferase RsmG [Deinococcus radiophilus]|uniref:16S rRNA (guanine(527)-N(7))-methyltransferase RsmG n=1 Tax=Deinococcus radiophilus TaxID=32062 RepID=UPI0036103FE0
MHEGAQALGVSLSPAQLKQFVTLYGLLRQGATQMNLTALHSERDVVLKHFVDSLGALQATLWKEPERSSLQVLDLGTGAGFPALPLAISCPALKMTAMDATQKKVAFVERTAEALGLTVRGLSGRAEDLGQDPIHRGRYDVVVTRAVASLPVLAELALPLLKEGGWLIAQKGQLEDAEVAQGERAISLLGGELHPIQRSHLPFLGDARALVQVHKVAPTPAKYPRRPGIPNKRPLGNE